MNEVINTINNRVSLRSYKQEKISKEDLDIILKSAMRAPTAGNMMLYSIIVVEDEEKKKKLSVSCDNQGFIAKAPVILIFTADMQRWFDYYEYSGVKEHCRENNIQYVTPDEGDFMIAFSDAVIAAQNAVIAAEALKIGSCYIGDIIEHCELHKEMFNLPKWTIPVGMLCLGYYPDDYNRIINPRFDEKYIVFNENYRRLSSEELEDMFKDRQGKVIPNNVYKAKNFGQLMYSRKTATEFSKEMTRSIKKMIEEWNS